jgi:hypothetical protein
MSPDIDWHIGDDAEQKTIATTTSARRSQRGWIAVLIVVVLGAAFGMVYRSIPEPAPRPTPTPIPPTVTPLPTPIPVMPPGVVNTIAQEAQALAHGDLQTFMAIQDADDAEWQQLMTAPDVFNAWGIPAVGALYTIVETGTLPNNRAWADVIQFRDGQRFRETRFYRLRNNQWVRTRPVIDQTFWGAWQTIQMPHFNLKFREKDMALAVKLADQLEAAYERICRDLPCAKDAATGAADQISYQVTLSGGALTHDQTADHELPSPRIAGLYFPEFSNDLAAQADAFNQSVYQFLVTDLMERLVNGSQSPALRMTLARSLWISAISDWELARLGIRSESALPWVYVHSLNLPPLESLWEPSLATDEIMLEAETSAFVKFMADTYGPDQVLKLLPQINTAPSLAEAIKQMGLSYTELQQKWQVWIKQLVESQS